MDDKRIFEEITLDDLEQVSGGRVKLAGYGLLSLFIWQMKQLGHSKEETVEAFIDGWNENCEFRKRFTDGTDADMETGLRYINEQW